MEPTKEIVEIEVKLPVKEKKPRTEKQKEAMAKALATLKDKREAAAKQERDVADAKTLAKEKTRAVRRREPGSELVTKKQMEDMLMQIKPVVVEKVVEKPVVIEKVVEKPVKVTQVIEKVIPAPKLSGHELLDRLFFNK